MNYLAHGFRFLDDPYFVAGTSLPDWLNVVDRRTRCRSRHAQAFVDDHDADVASFARGVVQHHQDDAWFHQTDAFSELYLQIAVDLRQLGLNQDSIRSGFVGHVLVELLIDAAIIRRRPHVLTDFYAAIERVEPTRVRETVAHMTGRPVPSLPFWISRFVSERFLADYGCDERLLARMNQVMARVRLPSLPSSVLPRFATARSEVDERLGEWFEEFR